MAKELNRKILLRTLKWAPWLLGAGYFLQCVLINLEIYSFALAALFGQSIFAILIIGLFSYSLGYCIWHRLPLYYILFGNLINIIDFYIGLSIGIKWILFAVILLSGILILVECIMKNKEHVKERNAKEKSIIANR